MMERQGDREYGLTQKGRELETVIIALTEWGDRWAAPQGPPILFEHEGCGGPVHVHARCDDCGREPARGGRGRGRRSGRGPPAQPAPRPEPSPYHLNPPCTVGGQDGAGRQFRAASSCSTRFSGSALSPRSDAVTASRRILLKRA